MTFIKWTLAGIGVLFLISIIGPAISSFSLPSPEESDISSDQEMSAEYPPGFGQEDLSPPAYDGDGLDSSLEEPAGFWDSIYESAQDYFGEEAQSPSPQQPPPPKSKENVTGQWRGSFNVGYGGICSGYGGNWSAILNDQDGNVSGNFDAAAAGYVVARGSVFGSSRGNELSFDVGGGGSGVNFTGEITGDDVRGTYTAFCPVDGAQASGDFSGKRWTRELPPPPLVCSPKNQTVETTGKDATITASGGRGTYNWNAPGGSPNSGSGSSFTTQYSYTNSSGGINYSVELSDNSQKITCSILVCPTPTPPPPPPPPCEGAECYDAPAPQSGPTSYIPPGCPR